MNIKIQFINVYRANPNHALMIDSLKSYLVVTEVKSY